ETSGEVAVHASQSREARISSGARAMALEQLSVLLIGRNRTRTDQRRLGRDFFSRPRGIEVGPKGNAVGSIVPALAQIARTGHPTVAIMVGSAKAATRPSGGRLQAAGNA